MGETITSNATGILRRALAVSAKPLLASASGALLALAFPYASLWPVAFMGVAPLLFALNGAGWGHAAFLGWLCGFVFFNLLVYWLNIFGISVPIMLAAAMGLYYLVFGLGARLIMARLSKGWRLAAIPALWVALEYLRSFGPYSFPWGTVGEAIVNQALMQSAAIAGGFGLSFVVIAINVVVYEFFTGGLKSNRRLLAASIVAVLIWYGFGLYAAGRPVEPATTKVALIQGNVPQDVKLENASLGYLKGLYLDLTSKAAEGDPDLIIWPESAIPSEVFKDELYVADVKWMAERTDAEVLAGAFDRSPDGRIHNAAFLLGEDNNQVYHKLHPVPFAEFVPLRSIAKRINPLVGFLGEDQAPGRRLIPITYKGHKTATVICFESAYSRIMAEMARAGAEVGIVITNDGWFGKSSAASQHFQLARFRAVENGFYVVQAANTGITGIIDPRGRVLSKTGLEEQAILHGAIGFSKEKTIYSKTSEAWPYVYFAIAIMACAVALMRRTPHER